MKLFNSLRSRIVFASFGMSLIVSLMFLAGGILALDAAEDSLFMKFIDSDASAYIDLYNRNPSIIDIPRDDFSVYVAVAGDSSRLPSYLHDLPSGADDVLIDGQEHDLLVKENAGNRFYFIINNTAFEHFEDTLFMWMSLAVVVIIVVSFLLSIAVANRVVIPIESLTRLVKNYAETGALPKRQDNRNPPFDEVQILQNAFYDYHHRISEMLEREKEFSIDVSHELRTPLMGIQGAAENMDRQSGNLSRNKNLANRILRCCTQMTLLIEGLLFLAREPANYTPDMETVNLRELVNEQIGILDDLAASKGIKIHVHGDDDLMVNAVPIVLAIIVNNIIVNAIKHTNKQNVNVFITDTTLSVQDFGPGMEASVRDKLFHRYERGISENSDGSGIGLFLVRRFCEQFGWILDVQSDPEEGTVMSIMFRGAA